MRVFLVEDELRLARSIKRGLERAGFAVDHFENGDKAADHLIMHHTIYDAVVLDLMLPGRSGEDICQVLRERGISIPILITTAKNATIDKVTLFNLGADDYITKPFSFAELVARIRALMRRPGHAFPPELIVGSLRLDSGRHLAFLNEKPLKLTVKEFSLLEFFMRHPDQVLDREYILDHVWDFNFNSFSNVIDVHVKNLRRKLGQTKDRVIIETIEGVGYRLVPEV